jgi:L-fuculose-phosphate aldolase
VIGGFAKDARMSGTNETELRACICEIGRRLYGRNLIAATDGNISVRIAPDRFLCTASGAAKGFMHPRQIVVADDRGRLVSGEGKVSSEFLTHLAAYERRDDIAAVVHAHPPTAVAFTLAGVSLEALALPEVVFAIGGLPTAPYATPGTPEGAKSVHELVGKCDALLLDRHGALTLGVSLMDAYYKMEKIEHSAQILLAARTLGNVRTLSRDELGRILRARGDYGAVGRVYLPPS